MIPEIYLSRCGRGKTYEITTIPHTFYGTHPRVPSCLICVLKVKWKRRMCSDEPKGFDVRKKEPLIHYIVHASTEQRLNTECGGR